MNEPREITELYCVDCDSYTKQKFRRIMPDHTYLYLCTVCGCENSEEIEEIEDYQE